MEASSRAWLKASIISMTVSGRKAFRTSGRLMVTLAIPAASSSPCSYTMSV
jgi:hypothetical protein